MTSRFASGAVTGGVPFTVIGGFLGSGKTTLLNHLLRHASGERIAVLVNDFGAVAIDADLIAEHDGDTIALANGCICCAVAGELALALPPLLAADPPFDRVVVECSGIADPGAVAQYGTVPGFRPDGVIVVADATAIEAQVADRRLGAQVAAQLDRADLVVVTKVDLVQPAHADRVARWVTERWPGAVVLPAPEGRVEPSAVFDTGLTRVLTSTSVTAPSRVAAASVVAPHGPAFTSAWFESDGAVDRAALDAWLDDLDLSVVRVKGIVTTTERPDERAVVHRVGRRRRWRFEPLDPSTAPGPGRLVLIALTGPGPGPKPPPGFHVGPGA